MASTMLKATNRFSLLRNLQKVLSRPCGLMMANTTLVQVG